MITSKLGFQSFKKYWKHSTTLTMKIVCACCRYFSMSRII